MDRGKRESLSSFFGGAGFYIALLLCVLVIGIVGYFVLFGSSGPEMPETVEDPVFEPVDQIKPAPVVVVDKPVEEEPVEVSKPVEILMPEEETEEQSEAVLPPAEPVVAQIPQVVVMPLTGDVVATFSGDQLVYNETTADWRVHGGVDISASAGTAVVAASAGTVLTVEEDPRLGVMVTIRHGDGYETSYASLQETVHVSEGEKVTAGQVIGAVGNTTLTESGLGAHLHFAVTKNGETVDPEEYLERA